MAATIRSTWLRTCARRRRTCRGASRPRCSRGPRPWRDGKPRGSGRRARAASGRATRQPGGRRSAISRPGPCPRRATRPRRPVPRARRRGRRRDAPGGQLGHTLQQGLRRLGEDLHRDQTSRLLRRAELLARDLLDVRTDDEADGIGHSAKFPVTAIRLSVPLRLTTHSFSSFPGMAIRNGSAACFSYFSRPSTSSCPQPEGSTFRGVASVSNTMMDVVAGEVEKEAHALKVRHPALLSDPELPQFGHSAPPEEANDAA